MDLMYRDLEEVLISKEEIAEGIRKLGQRITEDYAGKHPVMVCILKGAAPFYIDLIRQIDLPLTCDFMATSSYGSSTKTSGVVRLMKDLERGIENEDVLIVEDIVDTGLTLAYIKKILEDRGARSVKIVTLLDKPEGRKVELKADYSIFRVPNKFVVGYGLDYDEKYRNLPEIGVLKPEIYTK